MVAREHSKEALEDLVDMVVIIHTVWTHYTFGGVAGKALDIIEDPYDMEQCVVSDLVKILGKLIVTLVSLTLLSSSRHCTGQSAAEVS